MTKAFIVFPNVVWNAVEDTLINVHRVYFLILLVREKYTLWEESCGWHLNRYLWILLGWKIADLCCQVTYIASQCCDVGRKAQSFLAFSYTSMVT